MSEEIELANLRLLNETAIRVHALRCSVKYRAGKFRRVGEDFVDEVKVDVDCFLRELRNKYPTLHEALEPDENTCFTTGVLCDKLQHEVNRAIGRIIQSKVQRQPTTGVTLGRTR
jgi:hypothetical protein